MPLVLGPNGLEFVEAGPAGAVDVVTVRVSAPADTHNNDGTGGGQEVSGLGGTLVVQTGRTPAVEPMGAETLPLKRIRGEWEQCGYSEELAGFLEEACVDPATVADGAPTTVREVLTSAGSPFGPSTGTVRRLAASYAVTQALLTVGTQDRGEAPPAKRSLVPQSAERAVTPARRQNVSQPQAALAEAPGGQLTARGVEHAEKLKQTALLAAEMGPERVASALGFRPETWAKLPEARSRTTWELHATSFSAGRLQQIRRAVRRLRDWLEVNGLDEDCAGLGQSPGEGGVLAWWVQDEKASSRTEGLTVPASLRSGLVGARDHFGFTGLAVDASAFKNVAAAPGRTPKAAKAATTGMLFHLVKVATTHVCDIVRRYAAGFVLCMLSSMRIRDAQRAALRFDVSRACAIRGLCYTSKHPRRRQPLEMPIYVPPTKALLGAWDASLRRSAAEQPDYTFPRIRVPRQQTIEHPDVRVLDGPAKSAYVIKVLRGLLVLGGFMSETEAKLMTGHSLRHFLVTVARLLGYGQEDRSELGRWVAAVTEGVARRGALPNRYSNADGEEPRVLALVSRLLQDICDRVTLAGGPHALSNAEPWAAYASEGVAACADIAGEPSSSESSDSEATLVGTDID